jgi:hypothetical protein
MPIEIEFPLDTFVDVFESQNSKVGTNLLAPGGVSLTVQPYEVRTPPKGMAFDDIPIVPVLIGIGTSVAVNVFSSWLYDRLKSAPSGRTRLKINRRWVEVSKDGITRAFSESIEKDEE